MPAKPKAGQNPVEIAPNEVDVGQPPAEVMPNFAEIAQSCPQSDLMWQNPAKFRTRSLKRWPIGNTTIDVLVLVFQNSKLYL